MEHLRIPPLMATAAVALSLVLGGCGGSSSTTPTDTSESSSEAMPIDVMMSLALPAGLVPAAFALPDAGMSDSFTIAAGMTETRAGVEFTCDSAYPCTVTLTNSAGTLVAEYMTQKMMEDDMAMVMAAMVPPPPPPTVAPFDHMNVPNDANLATILSGTFAVNSQTPGSTATTPAPNNNPSFGTSLTDGPIGLGANSLDDATLTDSLDPNQPLFDSGTGGGTASAGSSISAAANSVGMPQDAQISGFSHHALFCDWGDTCAQGGDGGFETGALIYSDIQPSTSQPFDANLAGLFANTAVGGWFTLTGTPAAVTIATSATPAQAAGMVFDANAMPSGQRLDTNVDTTESFDGTYFGAPGTFACTATCGLQRVGDVILPQDTVATTPGIQVGSAAWTFTPAAGAMVDVPDQDWVSYGAWMTTPDDAANGELRVGTFYDGMDPHTYAATSLTGSATYTGGATGVFVDETATATPQNGFFTARARLTATFDANGDGTADTGDDQLTGTIDNFRDGTGAFLGSDNPATPNDPTAGENDWTVTLTPTSISGVSAVTGSGVTGSADGVGWTAGGWNARLYGPGDGTTPLAPPTGIAGSFQASSGTAGNRRGVAGSFGAQQD